MPGRTSSPPPPHSPLASQSRAPGETAASANTCPVPRTWCASPPAPPCAAPRLRTCSAGGQRTKTQAGLCPRSEQDNSTKVQFHGNTSLVGPDPNLSSATSSLKCFLNLNSLSSLPNFVIPLGQSCDIKTWRKHNELFSGKLHLGHLRRVSC